MKLSLSFRSAFENLSMSIPLKRRSDLSTEKNASDEVDCRRCSSYKRSEFSAYKLQNMDTLSEILQNADQLKDCYLLLMLSKIRTSKE